MFFTSFRLVLLSFLQHASLPFAQVGCSLSAAPIMRHFWQAAA
jgi:hypothetical protein